IESRSSPGRNNPVTGPYLGSVRGGAADVRDERAADARPARALEELLVPAPHDADRPPEEVLDRARAEEARVAALVAIVAHEENLALRHRDRAERAERGTVWQDANEVRPSAENLRAEENRLAIVVLLLRKEVDRLDLPVHIERLVPELDDVAREPDEALDERHASAVGVADDDDVSPSGRAGLEEADLPDRSVSFRSSTTSPGSPTRRLTNGTLPPSGLRMTTTSPRLGAPVSKRRIFPIGASRSGARRRRPGARRGA